MNAHPQPPRPSSGLYARFGKRLLDLAISLPVFLLCSLLMLLTAVLIKLEDGGPVLYRQERIGRWGRPFHLLKFRSMVQGAETKGAGILVEKNDSRITRVGRVIRRLSLDELAQLLNVIRGDMSVVGPRPGLRYQVEQYDEEQKVRLMVRPGITGLAQIKGRGAIRWPDRIRLDLEYIARMSLWMDISIILRTPGLVLTGADQISDIDYWKTKQSEKGEDVSGNETVGNKSATNDSAGSERPRA